MGFLDLFRKSKSAPVLEKIRVPTAQTTGDLDYEQTKAMFPVGNWREWEQQMATSRFRWERLHIGLKTPDELDVGTFYTMRHIDAQMKSIWLIYLHSILFKGGDFIIPRKKNETTEEQKINDNNILKFLRYVFNDYLEDGLESRLKEILTAIWAGYSVTEKVVGFIKDVPLNTELGKPILIGWARLFTIDPRRITHFVDRYGTIITANENVMAYQAGIQISMDAGTHLKLPAEKVVIYTMQREFGNWYGESMFRPAYQYYYSKQQIMKMANIFYERYASPTYMAVCRNPNDQGTARSHLKSMHTGRTAITTTGTKEEPNISFDMLPQPAVQGVASAYIEYLNWLDNQMTKAALVPSLMIGESTQGTGTYAMSQTHSDTFYLTIEAVRKDLERLIKFKLIKPLIEWNFGETDVMPEYRFKPYSEKDKLKMVQTIKTLIDGKVISPDEKWILEELELPERDESLERVSASQNALPQGESTGNLHQPSTSVPLLPEKTEIKTDWKNYVRSEDGVHVFRVDKGYVTKNIDSAWSDHMNTDGETTKLIGGHHWANGMEYIPESEVWVSSDRQGDAFEQTAIHELEERKLMKEGQTYEQAHSVAEAFEAAVAHRQGHPTPPKTITKSLSITAFDENLNGVKLYLDKREAELKAQLTGYLSDYADKMIKQAAKLLDDRDLNAVQKLTPLDMSELKRIISDSSRTIVNDVGKKLDKKTFHMKQAELEEDATELEWLDAQVLQTASVMNEDLLNDAKQVLISGIGAGKSNKQISDELSQVFSDFSASRIDNIVRTNTMTAYNEGRRITYDNVGGVIGYRFDATLDDRTTDLCNYLHGQIISKTDPAIDEYTPALHYQCRTVLTPILDIDKEEPNFREHLELRPWTNFNRS